jgi:hypothetical protein
MKIDQYPSNVNPEKNEEIMIRGEKKKGIDKTVDLFDIKEDNFEVEKANKEVLSKEKI